MANIVTSQAYTSNQQNALTRKELDCTVQYLGDFILAETRERNPLVSVFTHYGIPGKYPTGEFGYRLWGDVGVYEKPQPRELDYRVTQRAGETPWYDVKFSDFQQYESKYTVYYHRDKMEMMDPEFYQQKHLEALSRSLPKFLDWCYLIMFGGTKAKALDTETKRYGDQYIKRADGSTNGEPFFHSEGYMTINLNEVANKTKVTTHTLHKQLDDINKALRNDSRKVEVDVASFNKEFNTKWIKDNLSEDEKKALAHYLQLEREVDKILDAGKFDAKFKHNSKAWEGYQIPMRAKDFVICVSDAKFRILERALRLKQDFSEGISLSSIRGVPILRTWQMDSDESFILPRNLIRFQMMPTEVTYQVVPYKVEETTDYIYRLAFGITLIDIYSSIWIKDKNP